MPAIKDVEFREFSARHHNAERNWLVVKLNTDDPQIYGLGDASPMENEEQVKALVRQFVEKYLVGKDPLDSEVHWTTMYQDPHARGGRLATTALSGLDIALWDIKGKVLDRPVYQLLGGAQRKRIRVYANGWYTNPGTPEQNAEEAKHITMAPHNVCSPVGAQAELHLDASRPFCSAFCRVRSSAARNTGSWCAWNSCVGRGRGTCNS
ncbi:MAG: hypothetical protein U9R48_02730 [Chloroflexota bacterium]|nr:hypothetical protein [Chloroflexota bacterium]